MTDATSPADVTVFDAVDEALIANNNCNEKWARVQLLAHERYTSLEELEKDKPRFIKLVERNLSPHHQQALTSDDSVLRKKAQTRRSNDYKRVLRRAFPERFRTERFRADGDLKASMSVMGLHAFRDTPYRCCRRRTRMRNLL
jgi:hypothetical protein